MLKHQFACRLNEDEKVLAEKAMMILKDRGKIPTASVYSFTKYAILSLAHRTNASVLDGYEKRGESSRIQREVGS